MCEECQSIDPAPIQWEKGKAEVNRNWQRLGMDITHYSTHHFLMLTDCGPSHFSILKQLGRQDLASMICQLEAVFFKHGPPHEILRTMIQPSVVKSSKLSHMSGEFTYDFVVHTPQPRMVLQSNVTARWNGLQPGCTVPYSRLSTGITSHPETTYPPLLCLSTGFIATKLG